MSLVEVKRLTGLVELPVPERVVFRRLLGVPGAGYFLYVPASLQPGARMFVSVHGLNRNAAEHAFRFREEAERSGAVLVAPLFEKGVFGGYQQLVARGGARSDEVLLRIAEAVASTTGADAERLHLFGYSGGAQFVHRFAMLHPERAAVAVAGAAGWYSFPDPQLPYPFGVGPSPDFPDLVFRPDRFALTRYAVLVGERDTGRGRALRTSGDLDAQQGRDRLERARRWAAAMAEAAVGSEAPIQVEFRLLPRLGHSFGRLAEKRRRRRAVADLLGLSEAAAGTRSSF